MKKRPNKISRSQFLHDLLIVRKAVRAELKDQLISLVLFGSAVKSFSRAKDYDFFVLTKRQASKEWQQAARIKLEVACKISKPVDLIFQEEEDLNYPSPIFFEVGKKGKLLWGKDIFPQLRGFSRLIAPINSGGKRIGWKIAQ